MFKSSIRFLSLLLLFVFSIEVLAKDCTYCPLDYLPKEASFQTYAYDLLKKDRLSSLSSNIFSFDEMKNLPSPIQEKLFAELFYHIVSSSLPHNLYFNDLLNAQNELNLAEAHKLNVNLPTLYPQTLKDVQLNNVLILKTKLRQKYEEEKKLTYLQYDHLEQKETAFKTKVDKGLISIYDPIRGRASVTFLLDKKTNEYYEIDKVTLNYDDDTYLFHDEHINQNLLNWYVARIHIEGQPNSYEFTKLFQTPQLSEDDILTIQQKVTHEIKQKIARRILNFKKKEERESYIKQSIELEKIKAYQEKALFYFSSDKSPLWARLRLTTEKWIQAIKIKGRNVHLVSTQENQQGNQLNIQNITYVPKPHILNPKRILTFWKAKYTKPNFGSFGLAAIYGLLQSAIIFSLSALNLSLGNEINWESVYLQMGFTWAFSQAVGTFASTYRNLTYATLENTDLAQKERFFKRSLVSSIPFAFILGLLQNKTLSPIEIEGLVNWMWILVNTVLSNTAGTQMDQILQLTRIEDPKSDNWYFFNKKTKIKKAEFRENNMSMIKYLYKMFDLMDISFQQVKMGKIVAVTSIPLIQMIIINLANRLTLDNPKAIQMRKDMNARFERSYRKFFNITQGRFSLKNYLRENITSPEIVQMKAEFLSLLPDDETFADDANCLEDALFGR